MYESSGHLSNMALVVRQLSGRKITFRSNGSDIHVSYDYKFDFSDRPTPSSGI